MTLLDAARAITDRLPANIDHPAQHSGGIMVEIHMLQALRDAVESSKAPTEPVSVAYRFTEPPIAGLPDEQTHERTLP